MKRFGLATAIFAALTLAFGPALAQQDDDALEDVARQFEDVYNQGDVEGAANLHTEDAIVYDATGQVHEGREAIQGWLQGNIDAGLTEISLENIETEVLNDTAYIIASYTLMNDEGETASGGYTLVIVSRMDDEWQVRRSIVNMILPEEMMSAMMGEAQAAAPPEETEEGVETEAERATVQVAGHETHGTYLTDAEGRSLYLFLNDEQGESVCYDNCAQNWPPLLTTADTEVGEGVDADLLGTTERQDGSTQVTYNDWPLYYFARDEAPGDVTGQGVGGNWFLVSPEGEAIEGE